MRVISWSKFTAGSALAGWGWLLIGDAFPFRTFIDFSK